MKKKKQVQKELQKKLNAILEIYVDQKGKANRKLLKDFIEQKADEVLLYAESLNQQEPAKKQDKLLHEKNTIKPAVIQPSPSLVEAIHNSQNNTIQLEDAADFK